MVVKKLSREQLTDSVALVIGTRPGIVKFAPIIRELEERKMPYFTIHTGQHYSYNMDEIFFRELGIPLPDYCNPLTRLQTLHGAQTAEMLRFVEAVLLDRRPTSVIVGGDANTNLAGALATRKLGLTLYHLEAGLRSRDWRMPEEHNRVVIDHISDVLLAPTAHAARNLNGENVQGDIRVVGNTIVDAVLQNVELASKSTLMEGRKLPTPYGVLTIHREETVDHWLSVIKLLDTIRDFLHAIEVPVVFPVHPRTMDKFIKEAGYKRLMANRWIKVMEPLGYLDFLNLLHNAQFVMTDSGGVQEEACILKVPCLTLRNNTERPETVDVGANWLVGEDGKELTVQLYDEMLNWPRWLNPFGDGTTSKQICDLLEERKG